MLRLIEVDLNSPVTGRTVALHHNSLLCFMIVNGLVRQAGDNSERVVDITASDFLADPSHLDDAFIIDQETTLLRLNEDPFAQNASVLVRFERSHYAPDNHTMSLRELAGKLGIMFTN
jgi:hypothetical protein